LARTRDEQKREKILRISKVLFSEKGFANTSISDIVRETDMPVGTIYTYFNKKEEIITTIIEEGWTEISSQLERLAVMRKSGQEKLRIIVEEFIPQVLEDLNLINILLSEAIGLTRIEEKIEKITDIVFSIIRDIPEAQSSIRDLSRRMLQTSIVVVFLGILNAANLAQRNKGSVQIPDVIGFVKYVIEKSLTIEI